MRRSSSRGRAACRLLGLKRAPSTSLRSYGPQLSAIPHLLSRFASTPLTLSLTPRLSLALSLPPFRPQIPVCLHGPGPVAQDLVRAPTSRSALTTHRPRRRVHRTCVVRHSYHPSVHARRCAVLRPQPELPSARRVNTATPIFLLDASGTHPAAAACCPLPIPSRLLPWMPMTPAAKDSTHLDRVALPPL